MRVEDQTAACISCQWRGALTFLCSFKLGISRRIDGDACGFLGSRGKSERESLSALIPSEEALQSADAARDVKPSPLCGGRGCMHARGAWQAPGPCSRMPWVSMSSRISTHFLFRCLVSWCSCFFDTLPIMPANGVVQTALSEWRRLAFRPVLAAAMMRADAEDGHAHRGPT